MKTSLCFRSILLLLILTAASVNLRAQSISITFSTQNVTCSGGNNGWATASPSGGTGPYTYMWANGATTQTASSLSAGDYIVTVTDANAVTGSNVAAITQPSALVINAGSDVWVCSGGNAVIGGSPTASGGSGPYLYSWSPATNLSNVTGANPTANATVTTTYTVIVTDDNGCTNSDDMTVFMLDVNANSTSVCKGSVATLTAGGASTYSWSPSTGLSAVTGSSVTSSVTTTTNYTVTGTDANGCSATTTLTLTVNSLPVVSVNSTVFCSGSSRSLNAGGASTYSWTPSAGLSSTTGASVTTTLTSTNTASPGYELYYYTVTGIDANGCQSTAKSTEVVRTIPDLITSPSVSICSGSSTTLTMKGSVAGISYSWSWSTGTTCFFSLNNGVCSTTVTPTTTTTYTVAMTSANNCVNPQPSTVTVTVLPPVSITASTGSTVCRGTPVTLSASNGLTYNWSPSTGLSSTTGDVVTATPTATTTYSVTGCSNTATTTVTLYSYPTASISSSANVSCRGGNNGLATASASGGTSPYTYSWHHGETTSSISNLTAQTYSVTVTDANGCSGTTDVIITEPSADLSSNISSQTDAGCYGSNNGSATISASGGTPTYSYVWSNGATTQTASALSATSYSVTVTDAHGCTANTSVNIGQPVAITAGISSSTNIICHGGNNGSATVTASGGTPSYSYLWSNGATLQSASSLTAGTYSVTVTDAQGCTTLTGGTLTEPGTLSSTTSVTNVSCHGGSNGTAALTATGGTGAYTYSWSTGATTSAISGLSATTYTITVTDANGCTDSKTPTISQATAIAIPANISEYGGGYNISIHGTSDGTISPDPSGGTVGGGLGGYLYSWSTGSTTLNLVSLSAGTYSITVKDAYNCTATNTYTLTEPTALVVDDISSPVLNGGYNLSCNGGSDGTINVTVHGGVPNASGLSYSYQWSAGAFGQDVAELRAGHYFVHITDANGAAIDADIILTEPPAIDITTTPSYYPNGFNISSMGNYDGSIVATAMGGVVSSDYSYLWLAETDGSTISTSNAIYEWPAGLYSLTVTDDNGCSADKSKWLFQPAYGGGWDVKGNLATDADSNYLGTKDSVDLVIKTKGEERMRIKANGALNMTSLSGTGNGFILLDETGTLSRSGPGCVPWMTCGNTALTTDFIGTTNNVDLNLRANNIDWLRIAVNGDIQIKKYESASDGLLTNSVGYVTLLDYTSSTDVLRGDGTFGPVPSSGGASYWTDDGSGNIHNTSSGKVGIGTGANVPAEKLEIDHDDVTGGILLNRKTSGSSAKSEIKFSKNGTQLWSIGNDFDGNGHQTFFIWDNAHSPTGYAPFIINEEGRVGIGGGLLPPVGTGTIYRLYVDGGIATRDVKVTANSPWPDYVLKKDYKLMPLKELEKYISRNEHLPDLPSADEIDKNEGFEVGDIQTRLLKKVEELTLYVIEQQKQIDELKKQVAKK